MNTDKKQNPLLIRENPRQSVSSVFSRFFGYNSPNEPPRCHLPPSVHRPAGRACGPLRLRASGAAAARPAGSDDRRPAGHRGHRPDLLRPAGRTTGHAPARLHRPTDGRRPPLRRRAGHAGYNRQPHRRRRRDAGHDCPTLQHHHRRTHRPQRPDQPRHHRRRPAVAGAGGGDSARRRPRVQDRARFRAGLWPWSGRFRHPRLRHRPGRPSAWPPGGSGGAEHGRAGHRATGGRPPQRQPAAAAGRAGAPRRLGDTGQPTGAGQPPRLRRR